MNNQRKDIDQKKSYNKFMYELQNYVMNTPKENALITVAGLRDIFTIYF